MAIRFLDEDVAQTPIQKPQRVRFLEEKPSLPKFYETEEKIKRRQKESAFKKLEEEVLQPWEFKKHPVKTLFRPLVTGIKTLAVPFERGEAALANMLMYIQEKDIPEGISYEEYLNLPFIAQRKEDIKRLKSGLEYLSGLAKEGIKGLRGKRLGEIGDIFRRVGVPEPLSASLGFAPIIGAGSEIDKMINKSKISQGFTKIASSLWKRVPKVMNKNYVINRARIIASGLDDLYKGLSREYDEVYKKIGNRMVNIKKVQDIIESKVPQSVINRIAKDKYLIRYADGSIHPQIRNVKRMRDILRKSVPDSVWSGKTIGTPEQHFIKEAWYDLGDIIAEGNPELLSLNKRYKDFMKMRNTLARILYDAEGNIKSKGLENLFKKGAERSKQIMFEKLAQQLPQARQIMKDIIKFNKRQAVKSYVGRTLPWAIGLGTGGYGINRLLQAIEGQSYGE